MATTKITNHHFRTTGATVDVFDVMPVSGDITWSHPEQVTKKGDRYYVVPAKRRKRHKNQIIFDEQDVRLGVRYDGSMYFKIELDLLKSDTQIKAVKHAIKRAICYKKGGKR